jgi:stringent starvation protein B
MSELSTKPYLIRAIYEWCADSSFTPYLSVKVDQNTRVPLEYVKNGEIVLSMSQQATRNLTIGNELVQFSARFNGVSREITIPIYAVLGVFARENGRGVFFGPEAAPEQATTQTPSPVSPPALQSVSTTHVAAAPRSARNSEADAPDDGTPDKPPPDKPKAPPRGKLRVIK